MSAYIVPKHHILFLVESAVSIDPRSTFAWYHGNEWHTIRAGEHEALADAANMLWRENIRSVSFRYPGESSATLPGSIGSGFVIEPSDFWNWTQFDLVQVIKACHCYSYQTCEHPLWHGSEAKAFIDALIVRACHCLKGYDSAIWGAPDLPRRTVKLTTL